MSYWAFVDGKFSAVADSASAAAKAACGTYRTIPMGGTMTISVDNEADVISRVQRRAVRALRAYDRRWPGRIDLAQSEEYAASVIRAMRSACGPSDAVSRAFDAARPGGRPVTPAYKIAMREIFRIIPQVGE